MNKIKQFVQHHPLLLSSILYFLLRLTNLTLLPIFNDESIYLDWGWRELHVPGYLFYSLFDSKQPLLMWIFGIFQSIFSDPLFAGRFVSVLCGFVTLLGIYYLARRIFSRSIALLSILLYIAIPIFSFYDRQALMESAISAVGVWTLYILEHYLDNPQQIIALILGVILAIGFWIKSSVLTFIAGLFPILFIEFRSKKEKYPVIILLAFSTIAFVLCMIPLFLQSTFWSTFSSNSRYTLTLSELIGLPITHWLANIWYNTQIVFFFVTPLVSVCSLIGIYITLKNKDKGQVMLAIWAISTLILQTLLVRSVSQRYLVSLLPVWSIFAALAVEQLFKKYTLLKYVVLFLLFSIPFGLTLLQIISPLTYITDLFKITPMSQNEYATGNTSGIGIQEAVDYLQNKSSSQPIFVGIAVNTGNPENAILAYFEKSSTVHVVYFDARVFGNALDGYDCLDTSSPLYFVSRDNYLAGLAKYLVLQKKIENPYSPYYIGIYTLNHSCKGEKATIQLTQT